MKKTLGLLLCLAALTTVSMTGCGKTKELMDAIEQLEAASEQAAQNAATEEETTEEVTEEATTEEATEEVTEEETTEAATEEVTEEATEEAATEAEGNGSASGEISGDIINFDKMSFMINGYECVLGETTLQDLIDAGVPFDEDSIANANNNLNANYSMDFRVDLAEYWNATLYVMNDTDASKPANECFICELYLPVKQDTTQDVLSFNFPLNITADELLAAAGEPDEKDHYEDDDPDSDYYSDSYEWTKESERYYGDSSYEFEYVKGELRYLYIEYTP